MAACPACGEANPAHARFCGACGQSLGALCPECSAPVQAGSKFCVTCGARVEGTMQAPEMVKLVTVLFADVVGSTAQAERMQPDETRALMTDFFKAMSEEIESEGGTVERIIGDAVMADFGVPVAHEDDPLRAVRAARRMLRRLEQWNRSRSDGETIQIRIGVNTGRVSAAGDGDDDLLVTGDAVNVAARLEQHADPGCILVGERTARAITNDYALTEKHLTLKGKSGSVRAFLVGEELDPGGYASLRAPEPIVGRAKELDAVSAAMETATREARARLVTIVGEAGIGKSRLVEELAGEAEGRWGARVVHGRCLPYGDGVTLWPLAEILKSEAGLLASDSSKDAFAKIEAFVRTKLGATVPDERRAIRALASTIGLQEGDDDPIDPRQVYRDILATWRSLLGVMATRAPVVAIIEDLHWADPTMLDVLSYLADQVEARVLFVCPTRPELFEKRSWAGGIRNYSSLVLHPLSTEDSAALLDRHVGAGFPAGLKRRILETAEGNPFFLGEMVQSLRDRGFLDDSLGWSGTGDIADVDVPDNVQSVILSRIDVLPAREKAVLQLASVVGRTFWTGALDALMEGDGVEDALLSLERRGLVAQRVASSLAGELEYVFGHVLIRDVVSGTLPGRARAASHVTVARWLDSVTGDRASEYAELMAHHYERAHALTKDTALRSKARELCLVAASNAMRRAAVSQARALAKRALALSPPGPERAAALELLGDVDHFSHDGDAAWDAFVSAIGEYQRAGSPEKIGPIAAKAAILATRWEGTLKTPVPGEEVRAVIEKGTDALTEDQWRERSLLLSSKAFLQGQGYEQSDAAGRDAARQALEIAERLEDADLISTALDASAFWLLPDARYGDIDRIERRRLDLVPRLRDSREVSDVYAVAALSATFMGRYSEAAQLSEEAVERARGMDPGQYLYCLAWCTLTRFLSGNWDGALAIHAEVEGLDSRDAEGLPLPYAAAPYAAAMLCHELRGDLAEADAYLDLLERYRQRQARREAPIGITRKLAARTLAHRGDYEGAHRWVNLERTPYLGANIEVLCDLGIVSDDGKADEFIALARDEAARSQSPALIVHADRLDAYVAARHGDTDRAVQLMDAVAAEFRVLGAPWEEAWSLLLLARILQGRDARASVARANAALALFEPLGSVKEAEECRAFLRVGGQVPDDPPHVT
jgi:class 3 adenylate cyclase